MTTYSLTRSSPLAINEFLTFDMHDLDGALFVSAVFFYISVFATALTLILLFTTIYAPLYSQKSDFSIEFLNLIFLLRDHTFMTSSRWGGGGSGKKWSKFRRKWMVTGGRGVEWEEIRRNWMSRAIISISVIRVQTVFQTVVWLCYKCSRQVSGSAKSVPYRCLLLF